MNRTYVVLFLAAAVLMAQTGAVSSGALVSVNPASQTVEAGQELTVEIRADPAGSPTAGVQFSLIFDSSAIEFKNVTEGNFLKQSGRSTFFYPIVTNVSTGTLTVVNVVLGPGNTTQEGTVATIAFKAKRDGNSPLNLSRVILGSPAGTSIPLNTSSGYVLVRSAPPIIVGAIASHEIPDDTDNTTLWGESAELNVTVTDDSGLKSVTIDLSAVGGQRAQPMTYLGDNIWSATTNAAAGTPPATYNLTVTATDIFGNSNSNASIPLKVMMNGDVTGNGIVNIGDALRLANYVSHPDNATYALSSIYVADVTGNGVINIGDALRLANYVSHPGNPEYILK